MTEEIMSIKNAVDDLRYSAKDIERALDAVSEDGNRLMAKVAWLTRENAKLRELVTDMWRDGMCECDERGACTECEYGYLERMRELGIEVDNG